MRGVQRVGHSERERHPNGEGSSHLGQSGHEGFAGELGGRPQLEPPPGAPIRTAWIAGRIGLAFVDEGGFDLENAFKLGTDSRGGFITSLESLEALDVEQRPYIWDL